MLQNRVAYDYVFQMRAVLYHVNLFKCKLVINYENFVDFRLFFLFAIFTHLFILFSSVVDFYLETATYPQSHK